METDEQIIHYSKVINPVIFKYYTGVDQYKNRKLFTCADGSNPENIDIFQKYKKNVYSEIGEDGIIEYIYTIIEPKHKYYVEFGAWDGISWSNTANLRINKQWTGLLLEADENKVKKNKDSEKINLQHAFVTKDNINTLFDKYNVPQNFDVLSIDIDSDDLYVWDSLKYRPTIVIVEINPGIKNDLPLSAIENESKIHGTRGNYFGANLHAFYNLALKKKYKLLTVTYWNAIFIVDEEFDKFGIKEISKEKMLNKYVIYNKFWVDRNIYEKNSQQYWKIIN